MRILLVDTHLHHIAKRAYSEPAHLLGIYGLLRKQRHHVRLLSFPSPEELRSAIRKHQPEVVGFTAYQSLSNVTGEIRCDVPGDSLQPYSEIINKKDGILFILGGPGPSYNPAYFAKKYRPDVIVKGLGELPMEALARAGFSTDPLSSGPLFQGRIDETVILQAPRSEKWMEVSFKRPYKFGGGTAQVFVQIGCFSRCIFCPEEYPVRYRSLAYTMNELEYVFSRGAGRVVLAGPNFTADPAKASSVIEEINRRKELQGRAYVIDTREDTLHECLEKHGTIWRTFLGNNQVEFAMGLESFIPEKNVALGKYRDIEKAQGMNERLYDIAGIARDHGARILFSWILFWPNGTIEEARTEINSAMDLLLNFGRTVQLFEAFNVLRQTDNPERSLPFPAGFSTIDYALFSFFTEIGKDFMPEGSLPRLATARLLIDYIGKLSLKTRGENVYVGDPVPTLFPFLQVRDGRALLRPLSHEFTSSLSRKEASHHLKKIMLKVVEISSTYRKK